MNKSDRPTYVIGHKNPDTDSICSAIAYAELKRQTGENEAVACRCGEINEETQFVLQHFDAPEPVDIDIPVTEETDLHPYGFSAKVIMTPGHTLDSISVVFDTGETFVGDTVLDPFEEGICSMAVLSLDDELLKESGKKLLDAGLTAAYSGHGGPFTREQVEQAYTALVDHNG